MLGISGTGMASLAGLLKAKGYTVTGSDIASYPPMSTQLERMGISPSIGWSEKNLVPAPDLVIIGNVIRRDNPEAQGVIKRKLPYLSMPKAVAEIFLKDKQSIVVAGTHGKTTTSHLIAWLLEYAGKDPSFLIGGVGLNFGEGFKLGGGDYFVIEGDEYDTAFFDKGPKFLHYKPRYAIINSIEFDHADIYKDLYHIKTSFEQFAKIIQKDGLLAINGDSETVKSVAKSTASRVLSWGFCNGVDYRISGITCKGGLTRFTLSHKNTNISFESPLVGRHNISNASSAIILLREMGIPDKVLAEGVKLFKGVKRRQEVRATINGITLIDDFAHHPTAIAETIDAVRMNYPGRKIFGIFEPRSNTARRNIFEVELVRALGKADVAIIAEVFHSSDIKEDERLNPQKVADAVNKNGGEAHFISRTDEIAAFTAGRAEPGDIVLIMSNGDFDNINEKLIQALHETQKEKIRH